MEFKYTDLYKEMNICKGDVVDVASDLASIMLYCKKKGLLFDANNLIDSLKETVTDEGTVLIRTFTWDFCKGIGFDVNKSVSRVGALGNVALKRDDFKRTTHPIYSWMVWGKHKEEFVRYDNISSFGNDSIFEALYRYDAKQLSLGNIDGDSCTQVHHSEAMCDVPYRYNKPFTGKYTDASGKTDIRTYSMHVRPLNIKVYNPEFHDGDNYSLVESKGIAKKIYHDDAIRCLTFDLHKMQDFIMDDICNNNGRYTVHINGEPGINHPGIDYKTAEY